MRNGRLENDRCRGPGVDARDGSSWFNDGGVAARLRNGVVQRYESILLDRYPLGAFPIFPTIAEDRHGIVWIHAQTGLFRVTNGVSTQVAKPGDVLAMSTDANGEIALLTPRGLADGRMEPIGLIEIPRKDDLYGMVVDREGNVWIGTSTSGLQRLKRARITSYSEQEGLSDPDVVAITSDGAGGLWLAHRQLYRFHNGAITTASPAVAARALYTDRDGSLWLGYNGVTHLVDGRIQST